MSPSNKNQKGDIDLSKFFGEDKQKKSSFQRATFSSRPKLTQWLVSHSWGLIRTKKQAAYILLVVITITFITGIVLIFKGISSGPKIPERALENPERGWLLEEGQEENQNSAR